jgi:hypothetical protein
LRIGAGSLLTTVGAARIWSAAARLAGQVLNDHFPGFKTTDGTD